LIIILLTAKTLPEDIMKPLKILANLLEKKTIYQKPLLNQFISKFIPFNGPHGFKVLQMDETVQIKIPYKRKNMNHVKGIHACAIATLGELCAGFSMMKHIPVDRYRFIMSNLSVEYFFQGKTDLLGQASLDSKEIEMILQKLKSADSAYIEILSKITDIEGNHVANVTSKWQLKDWKEVKLKV